ncbi:hypothetical protein V6N13_083098 [Hibiscus sabdariffa]
MEYTQRRRQEATTDRHGRSLFRSYPRGLRSFSAKDRQPRSGVMVFVDYVSKRIHKASLKEAFSGYGRVTDVYIAYYNPRRSRKRYTFAFVRFSTRAEAVKAIEMGNNRSMDGFYLKVFMGKNQNQNESVVHSARDESENDEANKDPKHADIIIDPFHFSLPEKDTRWLTSCLVGQIKIIFVNGVRYSINISVSEYENERSWIVAEDPKGQQFEISSQFPDDDDDSCRIEVQGQNDSAKVAVGLPRKVEDFLEDQINTEHAFHKNGFSPRGTTPLRQATRLKRKKVSAQTIIPNPESPKNNYTETPDSAKQLYSLQEAIDTLEVCNKLSVHFAEKDETIQNRLCQIVAEIIPQE